MKVIKTVLPAEGRQALYVGRGVAKRVEHFHDTNKNRTLWISVEAVVEAGLEALGVPSLEEIQQEQQKQAA